MPKESTLKQKRAVIDALSEEIKGAQAVIFADYRGLTVQEDTELRSALRKAGIEYKVVKNTLTRFAVKENGFEGLEDVLSGPTSMATSAEDPVAPAKILNDFAKKNDKFEIKAGILEGKVIGIDEIKALADLPSREVLIAKALGGLNAPIAGFANVLNANLTGLVRALNAIAEKQATA